MNDERPTQPDIADRSGQSETRDKSPKTINPSRVDLGFPSGAVDALRDGQRQLDEEGVEVGVSRQAVDETLAWIDRYVPRALQTAETVVVDEGYRELRIDTEDPAISFDLIRLNGQPFVPEVATIVEEPGDPGDDSFETIRGDAGLGSREASFRGRDPKALGFDDPHASPGERRRGGGREGRSISHSYGGEGFNHVD